MDRIEPPMCPRSPCSSLPCPARNISASLIPLLVEAGAGTVAAHGLMLLVAPRRRLPPRARSAWPRLAETREKRITSCNRLRSLSGDTVGVSR